MLLQHSLFAQIDDLPIMPFPGNKRKYLSLFMGHERFNAYIEPFIGGGALALASNCPAKYVADADRALQIQWRLIIARKWDHVLEGLRFYQNRVAKLLTTQGYSKYLALTPGDRRDEAKKAGGQAISFMEAIDEIWKNLLDKLQSRDPLDYAIAALAIRKLGYQAVIRQGKGGQLNIKWSICKLQSFVNFQGRQPYIKGDWKFYNDAFEAIRGFREAPSGPAIAIVDPPYWLPWVAGVSNQMTPAYKNHLPHDESTFQLGVESLSQLANCPEVTRVVYCNYFSDRMNEAVREIAESNFQLKMNELKALDDGGERIDTAWILTRKSEVGNTQKGLTAKCLQSYYVYIAKGGVHMSDEKSKMVRIPEDLHTQLKVMAAKEKVSMAQLIERLLRQSRKEYNAA